MSTSGPEPEATERAREMLLDFLREQDCPCPVCGYSLKSLARPICPECGHELMLTVGAMRPHLGWLLAALAPGFFSGIAAVFVLVPVVGQFVYNGTVSPVLAVDLFGWCSGVWAIVLAVKRNRFLGKPRLLQRRWAIITWLVHIAALGLFILFAWLYL